MLSSREVRTSLSRKQKCPTLLLAPEVLHTIFSYLSFYDLVHASQTCHQWRNALSCTTSLSWNPNLPKAFIENLPFHFPLLEHLEIKGTRYGMKRWSRPHPHLRQVITDTLTIMPALLSCPKLSHFEFSDEGVPGHRKHSTLFIMVLFTIISRLTHLRIKVEAESDSLTLKLPDKRIISKAPIAIKLKSLDMVITRDKIEDVYQFLACIEFPMLDSFKLQVDFLDAQNMPTFVSCLPMLFPNLRQLTLISLTWESLAFLPPNLVSLAFGLETGVEDDEGNEVVLLSQILGHQKQLVDLYVTLTGSVKLIDDMRETIYPSLQNLLLHGSCFNLEERFPDLVHLTITTCNSHAVEVFTRLGKHCQRLNSLNVTVTSRFSGAAYDTSFPFFPKLKLLYIYAQHCEADSILELVSQLPELSVFRLIGRSIDQTNSFASYIFPHLSFLEISIQFASGVEELMPLLIGSPKLKDVRIRHKENNVECSKYAILFPNFWRVNLIRLLYPQRLTSTVLGRWIHDSAWVQTLRDVQLSINHSVEMWTLMLKFLKAHPRIEKCALILITRPRIDMNRVTYTSALSEYWNIYNWQQDLQGWKTQLKLHSCEEVAELILSLFPIDPTYDVPNGLATLTRILKYFFTGNVQFELQEWFEKLLF